MKYCYLNGKILPLANARLPLDDLGVLRGYGVFDFLRTYNGKPFLLDEHLKRLKNSAREIGLTLPISIAKLKTIIADLLKKNGHSDSYIRIVVTGGQTDDGITPSSPTLFILIEELRPLPESLYQKGVKLMTHEYLRDVPRAKTTNYIVAVKLQKQKKREGAFEILYVAEGKIFECATSNFFIFRGPTLVTPKRNVLIGTTRNFVIAFAKKHFTVEERDMLLSELETANEAFITATNKEILPVVKIDNRTIGTGRVGKNTKYLLSAFRQCVKNL